MPVNKKFRKKVREALDSKPLRSALGNFARAYPQARETAYEGIDFESLREAIETIKINAAENVEALAQRFEQKVTEQGGKFYRAADGEASASIIKKIARQHNAALCVKSKSMASEEIHLNHRLKDILKVVETDLGEWIIQQIDERPSHMVMPAIHLSREECAEIFSNVLGTEVKPDIPRMVKLARQILRAEFLVADIGITGCNIAVAETGTMVIFTNEGNGRLTATLPPVHIVLLGYEKLVSRFKDIGPLANALPRSATCQFMTSYVTMISGPCPTFKGLGNDEVVQKELHVILLDNGRLQLLKDPVFKTIGQCIRCASCLNVCPVYGLVGGQVYGDIYSGGIGALLTAFLRSPQHAEKIQELCLNCGKCREFCPAKINIPELILELRSSIRKKIPPPFLNKTIIDHLLHHKRMVDISMKIGAPAIRYLRRLPVPPPAPQSFNKICKNLKQEIKQHPDQEGKKGTIAFFYGCLIDYFYPEIGESMVRLLNRSGYRVVFPDQSCCGAPAVYTGLEKSAKKMAGKNLQQLSTDVDTYDYIVTACPTGTVMLTKHWQHLFENDPEIFHCTEMVAEKTVDFIRLIHMLQKQGLLYGKRTSSAKEIKVTYHYSCHLKRDSGIDAEPREVVSAIPGVQWIEMDEADRCCGFAGTYSMKLPEISSQLLKQKIENIEKSGAEILLVDCPGCLTWLRHGLETANSNIRVLHTAVFLAEGLSRDTKSF
ncbi:MAG: 4Fe-4S dicluster domain-containing protein [Candidatus Aminicenantes bacterium]|nr:4Fe-4S dicluster domain-containing protein [Candidatus Aminicenantes bacterium]NIM83031.1 4Fe-4S dicluster domain-containing protein [Candidatus Aminicenantes bacterium]NIN22418.1 4Fe-4S dicluster domain-containing protein [Candidatus Aminicenantes bacterium]NIN46186.1 4Fe-4S dicluster domain-containing protein [Candidatus Aminicenantes bacterium]NIN89023.1 4Fe-4S dicluster domain-containing protein [Candidatus Aminicenantes bacterium]